MQNQNQINKLNNMVMLSEKMLWYVLPHGFNIRGQCPNLIAVYRPNLMKGRGTKKLKQL